MIFLEFRALLLHEARWHDLESLHAVLILLILFAQCFLSDQWFKTFGIGKMQRQILFSNFLPF